MSRTTEDHDSPWKEALGLFFQPFLQLLYPDIHNAIDWAGPCTFLDKELQKLAPNSRTGRRHVDKLVQAWFRDGHQRWLLIHVEVQAQPDPAFPERMFVYYHRIREHYGKEVISLAVLTDANTRYRPEHFVEMVAGSGVHFRFRTAKLLEFRDRMKELQSSDNPFGLLVAAQLTAKLEKDGKQRADNLIGFYRLACKKRLGRAKIVRLIVFLEWLVALPPEIKEGYYHAQIDQLRRDDTMPYVSMLEEIGIKRGIEQGLEQGIEKGIRIGEDRGRLEGLHEGRAAMLLRQLQLKFGELPEDICLRVAQADQTELDLWAERILFADSIETVLTGRN
jgi:hypothetical protein